MFYIAKLTFNDLFDSSGKFKTLAELNNIYSINIPLVTYFRLWLSVSNLLSKIPAPASSKSVPVRNFLNNFKKGSKRIRNVITDKKYSDNILPALINNYCNIADVQSDVQSDFFSNVPWFCWSLPFLANDFREFLYKYFYNKLGINSRTFHFGGETKNCTFCTIVVRGMGPVPKESFKHLFFECPPVTYCREQIFNTINDNTLMHNNLVWSGQNCPDFSYQLFYLGVQ
jgi:hypothetical protein